MQGFQLRLSTECRPTQSSLGGAVVDAFFSDEPGPILQLALVSSPRAARATLYYTRPAPERRGGVVDRPSHAQAWQTVATAQMRWEHANTPRKAGDGVSFGRFSSCSSVPISANVCLFILQTVEVCIRDGSAVRCW